MNLWLIFVDKGTAAKEAQQIYYLVITPLTRLLRMTQVLTLILLCKK